MAQPCSVLLTAQISLVAAPILSVGFFEIPSVRCSTHTQNGLERVALLGLIGGFVDLIQLVEFNQTVEREASLRVEIDQPRDEDAPSRAPPQR